MSVTSLAQSLLGIWVGSAGYRTAYGTSSGLCQKVTLVLRQDRPQELHMVLKYDCLWGWDWFASQERVFPLDPEGNFLGEDGFFKDQEFYWNNAIAWKGGTKIRLKLDPQGFVVFFHEEASKNGDQNIPQMSGRLQKNLEAVVPEVSFSNQLDGKWRGKVSVKVSDLATKNILQSAECEIPQWTLKHKNGVLYQTHFYIPKCGSLEVNEWIGAFFFKAGKVYRSSTDFRKELVEVGVYGENGFRESIRSPRDQSMIEIEILKADQIVLRRTERSIDIGVFPRQETETELNILLFKI